MRTIPTIGDPERYIDSAFVDSAFIELKSCDLWDVKMLYPILHMDHAEENCFVRKEMYERLGKAAGTVTGSASGMPGALLRCSMNCLKSILWTSSGIFI